MKEFHSEFVGENIIERAHKVRIEANRFVKFAEEQQIPCFIAYYVPNKGPEKGYEYKGVLPEDCDMEDVKSEYGRFIKFMQVCANFNKEDAIAKVTHKKKRQSENDENPV